MDGEDNHVHLLVNYPAKHSISTLAEQLERRFQGRMLRRERPDLRPRYWKGVLWSPSYFAASCAGAPIGILEAYIEQQKKRFKNLTGAYSPALQGEVLRPHG